MNHHAKSLVRKARGIPKTYTPEELAKRTERLNAFRHKRWPQKPPPLPPVITTKLLPIPQPKYKL